MRMITNILLLALSARATSMHGRQSGGSSPDNADSSRGEPFSDREVVGEGSRDEFMRHVAEMEQEQRARTRTGIQPGNVRDRVRQHEQKINVGIGSSEEDSQKPEDTQSKCCLSWESFWKIFLGITFVSALAPTVWKAANNDGKIQVSYDENRGFFANGDHWAHAAQGGAVALLFVPIDWDWVAGKLTNVNWLNCCSCCGDKAKATLEVCLQLCQTALLAFVATFYPLYNLKKREIAAVNGHYQNEDEPRKKIFFDGSFWVNHTDYVLGMLIGVVLVFAAACFWCKKTEQHTWRSTIRRSIHGLIMVLIPVFFIVVSARAISQGYDTRDNVAFDG